MNTRAGRIPLITLFLLVLLGSLVPLSQLMPGRASADYLSDARKQETLYEYGQEVKQCIRVEGSGLHTEQVKLTGTPSTSNWINGNFSLSGTIDTALTLDKDSSKWCGDVLTTALTAFGYTASTYKDFLTSLGYSCSVNECNLVDRQEDIPKKFEQLLGTLKIPLARDDTMTYVQLLQGMQQYCSLGALASPSQAEQASGDENKDGYIAVYTTSSSSGTVSASKTYYKYNISALSEGDCVSYAAKLRESSKTVTDAIVASFTKQSTAFEKDAITAAVCGSAPIGDGPLERYAACITKVSTAYDKCLAQAGSAGAYYTQTKEEYTAALAACIATDTGASVDTIRTALAEAASKISDLAGSLTTTTAAGSTAEDNCPLPAGTSLRWLGCAVFDGLYDIANGITSAVNSLLYTPSEIFEEEAARKAANVFRNIGIALVVIAALFMVISEASGWQIVDAYTIRKLMPRMAIVLAAIALAWPLLRLAVELTNDLGALIHSVFLELASEAQATGDSTGAGSSITSLLLWLLGGGGVLVVLGGAGLLSLIATIVLALLIGLFVLSIRQLVVLMCIILAPIAFASYVLPGTQKLWAFWKNTFMTTLLMYPLIMGFIGAGKAMSFLLGATNMSTQSNIMQLLVVIVYFAPYFMLPFAFKLAGGLMSTLFSLANEKGNGMFGRMRKFRQGSTKQRFGEFASGRRGGENNIIGKGAALATAVSDPSVGLGGILKGSGRQGVYNTRTKRAAAEAIKNAAHGTFDDDYAVKVAEEAEGSMGDDEWTRRYVHLATAKADADFAASPKSADDVKRRETSIQQARANALKARRVLEMGSGLKVGTSAMHEAAHHARAVSKTGFTAGRTGVRQAFEEAAAEVSAGRMTSLEAMGILKEAQRLELSSISFGAGAQMIQDIADGGGSMGEKQLNTMLDSSVQFLQPSQLAGARWETVQTIGEHLHTQLKAAFESGDNEKIGQAMADFASFHDSVNYYNPENKKRFEETVLNMKAGTSGMNMREYEEALRVGPPPPPRPEDTPLTPEQQASVDTHAAQAKAFANRRKEFPNRESQENAAILAGQQGMGPPR